MPKTYPGQARNQTPRETEDTWRALTLAESVSTGAAWGTLDLLAGALGIVK